MPVFWEYPLLPLDYPPILLILIGSFSFQVKTMLWVGYNYKSMNLTKPRTYVKGYTNYYICMKLKALVFKITSGMRKRSKSLIRSLCTNLMRHSNHCHTQYRSFFHTKHGKESCALRVILTYLDIQRRPELSHEVKILSKIQIWEFQNCNTQHIWSCLIRCVNRKWIRQVLWKIQSGHDFLLQMDGQTYRWPNRRMDRVKPVYPRQIFGEDMLNICALKPGQCLLGAISVEYANISEARSF